MADRPQDLSALGAGLLQAALEISPEIPTTHVAQGQCKGGGCGFLRDPLLWPAWQQDLPAILPVDLPGASYGHSDSAGQDPRPQGPRHQMPGFLPCGEQHGR